MANLKLVKEQIRYAFPESNCQEEELIGLDIDGFGRLSMNEKLSIHVSFNLDGEIELDYLKMFFQPRLNFEGTALYIKNNSLDLYCRYTMSGSNFKRSLKRANNFIDTAKAIMSFVEYTKK